MSNIQHRICPSKWDSEGRNWFTIWVSNPRPTGCVMLPSATFVNCIYHKNMQQFRRSGLQFIVSCFICSPGYKDHCGPFPK